MSARIPAAAYAVIGGTAAATYAVGAAPIGVAGGAAVLLAGAVWHGWDRTTIGDRERWTAARADGVPVPLSDLMRAHFLGTSAVGTVDDESTPSTAVAVRVDIPETWLYRVGAALHAIGYPTTREFATVIAHALAAAGPVPDGPDVAAWVDDVIDQILAEGYRTRLSEARLLVDVARAVGYPPELAGVSR